MIDNLDIYKKKKQDSISNFLIIRLDLAWVDFKAIVIFVNYFLFILLFKRVPESEYKTRMTASWQLLYIDQAWYVPVSYFFIIIVVKWGELWLPDSRRFFIRKCHPNSQEISLLGFVTRKKTKNKFLTPFMNVTSLIKIKSEVY